MNTLVMGQCVQYALSFSAVNPVRVVLGLFFVMSRLHLKLNYFKIISEDDFQPVLDKLFLKSNVLQLLLHFKSNKLLCRYFITSLKLQGFKVLF